MTVALLAPRYSSGVLYASVTRILEANQLCSMATRSEAGVVDINSAFFAFTPRLACYFLSHPASAHCRNLLRVPSMAMTVCDGTQAWGAPHTGLQLYGVGSRVPPEECTEARASYAARFPAYFDLILRASEGELGGSLRGLEFYQFQPRRIKILDEVTFGDAVCVQAEVGS